MRLCLKQLILSCHPMKKLMFFVGHINTIRNFAKHYPIKSLRVGKEL